ncbi:lysosomal proton-coupled steroid conjugate and bile acid symporter SLC46A3-like [Branchiostoma floridae x Branchiostoma belcheri]
MELSLRDIITVEPVIGLYMMALNLQTPVLQQVVWVKSCLSMFNQTFCGGLEKSDDVEIQNAVQSQASIWILANMISLTIPSIIITVFVGPWSDRVGRKVAMILPMLGGCLMSVNLIFQSWWIQLPWYLLLIGPFISGFCGGFATILLSVFSYLADVTSEEVRTKRMGIVDAVNTLGCTVGLLLGGVMADNVGYVPVFITCSVLQLVAILYIIFWLKNPTPVRQRGTSLLNVDPTEQKGACLQFFSLSNIKKVVQICTKKRPNNRRLHVNLTYLCLFLSALIQAGVAEVGLLFVKAEPLKWSESLYGYWQAAQNVIPSITLLVVMPFLAKRLPDTALVIIGAVSFVAKFEVMAFSSTTWLMFCAAVAGAFQYLTLGALHGMISKLVDSNEQGATFSLMGVLECGSALFSSLIFNSLYAVTLTFFHGTCFLLMATMGFFIIVINVWQEWDQKPQWVSPSLQDSDDFDNRKTALIT